MIAIYDRKKAKRRFGSILARALGMQVFTPETVQPRARLKLFNWGCSQEPALPINVEWVGNTPNAVAVLSNKRKMFRSFAAHDIPCLEWTVSKKDAEDWLDNGHVVYARRVLQGHSGEGIERVLNFVDLPDAPLYTKGITGKFREYRVHVANSKVIAVQIKRRMSADKMAEMGIVPPNEETRSAVRVYRNGWVFCVNNVNLSDRARHVAVDAIRACGGTCGATDMLEQANGNPIVIETNSAPALRSPTVKSAYADAIRELAHV